MWGRNAMRFLILSLTYTVEYMPKKYAENVSKRMFSAPQYPIFLAGSSQRDSKEWTIDVKALQDVCLLPYGISVSVTNHYTGRTVYKGLYVRALERLAVFVLAELYPQNDEGHFWLNGYVNKQNCRIWSEANPQVYVETPLHPEKLTVWCALWAGGIIGPYFFKNDEGHNVTVNGDRYRAMITNFFIPELNNHDVQELWFQQDGATCHTARATIDLLKDMFVDDLISRFGPVNWPPRSCNLTPLDYFLWGHVKSLIYADKPEDNIRRVIADIRPQMLEKSSKIGRPDWTTSDPAVTVICQKSYLKCNATRLSFE
ncbi:DUF4817 domain-containing protein [Trichonephila clavipes]|nr:DUF4817 domain-containing protein [Trichonephila clavipes]